MILHPDTLTPWLPQRLPLAFDVPSQPNSPTLADTYQSVNVQRFRYPMVCSFGQHEGRKDDHNTQEHSSPGRWAHSLSSHSTS